MSESTGSYARQGNGPRSWEDAAVEAAVTVDVAGRPVTLKSGDTLTIAPGSVTFTEGGVPNTGASAAPMGSMRGQRADKCWVDEATGYSLQVVTLLGRQLYIDDSEGTPDGAFAVIGRQVIRPDGTTTHKVDGWKCSRATYAALREQNPDYTARAMNRLKVAEMKGETVVQGVVRTNARRPPAAQKPNRGNIADLRERTQRLVVQIATMSDNGPIPDGQVAELSKSYAALQAELDEALDAVDAAKENLSIIRAVFIEHSDPRSA